jgi:hypothetical protein
VIVALLMSTKSQVLRVIFRTPGRVDVEPPSVVDSLRKCAAASLRAWQAAVDAIVNDAEDEVVEIVVVFFPGCPSSPATRRCSRLAVFFQKIRMYRAVFFHLILR